VSVTLSATGMCRRMRWTFWAAVPSSNCLGALWLENWLLLQTALLLALVDRRPWRSSASVLSTFKFYQVVRHNIQVRYNAFRLHYFVANLFLILHTKFYQNRLSFAEENISAYFFLDRVYKLIKLPSLPDTCRIPSVLVLCFFDTGLLIFVFFNIQFQL